jgi:large subunit ribosomal protein L29
MKIKEIRTLTDDDIGSEIEKARAKIFKMRFQGKGENVENSGSITTLRRHIARLQTVIRERSMSRQAAAAAAGKEQKS